MHREIDSVSGQIKQDLDCNNNVPIDFRHKRNSVRCQINRKSTIVIQIWFNVTRLRADFLASTPPCSATTNYHK